MKYRLFLAISLLLVLLGCTKEKEVLVPDNQAPPDYTVSELTIESYANRVYISLLGRKPSETEFQAAKTALRANNFTVADRESFLNSVFAKPEYNQNLFDLARTTLLEGTDTTEINENVVIFQLLLTDPNYQALWPAISAEITKLEDVLAIVDDLNNNSIDVPEMHRRMIFNYIYDQLNMGTQNFVISSFQHFLDRYPTTAELEKGELMVNGFPSTLFLQSGDSKTDYLSIFFASNDYYEGQVRELFGKYLYRSATSVEMAELSDAYKTSGDYNALQAAILSTDEFAGL